MDWFEEASKHLRGVEDGSRIARKDICQISVSDTNTWIHYANADVYMNPHFAVITRTPTPLLFPGTSFETPRNKQGVEAPDETLDLRGTHRRLTPAISGGAQSVRRLLCLQAA